MKKKKIKLLISSMAVAAILIGGTLAWFQFHDEMPNKFTVGSVKTSIHETFDPDQAKDMQPGTTIKKDVTIKNNGKSDALLRVKINPTWDKDNTAVSSTDLTLNLNTKDWLKGNDGYYYYRHIFKSGATTTDLLQSVTLNKDLADDKAGQGFTVNVTSDAVQTTNGAWQDTWNVTKDNDLEVYNLLEGMQTVTNLDTNKTATSETSGTKIQNETHSDAQTPLAK